MDIHRQIRNHPDTRAAHAAIRVASYFTQAKFHALFDDFATAPDWTTSDALAAWYALGYFCFLFSVSTSDFCDEQSIAGVLSRGHDQLLYQWKMSDSVAAKHKAFIQENIREAFAAHQQLTDSASFHLLFVHFVNRILGGKVSFADKSELESLLKGHEILCLDPTIPTRICALYLAADEASRQELMGM